MNISADEFYRIRKVYKLSQDYFAALCDIDRSYVSKIETGKRPLSDNVKRRLIAELELNQKKLSKILEIYEEYKI